MTHSSNPWKKLLEKRTANIGFISRTNAFKDPSPAEIARAIMVETESWQKTKGLRPYTVSAEYKNPMGHGTNLKATREFEAPILGVVRYRAVSAYVEMPMDDETGTLQGILEKKGQDISTYQRTPGYPRLGILQRIKNWFKSGKTNRKAEKNQFVEYLMKITPRGRK